MQYRGDLRNNSDLLSYFSQSLLFSNPQRNPLNVQQQQNYQDESAKGQQQASPILNLEVANLCIGRRDYPFTTGQEYEQPHKNNQEHLLRKKLLSLKLPDYTKVQIKDQQIVFSSDIYKIRIGLKFYDNGKIILMTLIQNGIQLKKRGYLAQIQFNYQQLISDVTHICLTEIEPLIYSNYKSNFENYYLCYLDYLIRAQFSAQILQQLEEKFKQQILLGKKGILDVFLGQLEENNQLIRRLSIKVQCLMEFQQNLVKLRNQSNQQYITIHYEYVIYNTQHYSQFIERIERDHKSNSYQALQEKLNRLQKEFFNKNFVYGNERKISFSSYQFIRRKEQIQDIERDYKRLLDYEQIMSSFNPLHLTEQQQHLQKTIELSQNAKLKYPLHFFRSPVDIIDVWSDLNFTEFESIKNGYTSFNAPQSNNIQSEDLLVKQQYLKAKFTPFLKLENYDPQKINENAIFSVTNGENQNQSSSLSLEEQSYQYVAESSLEQEIDAKKAIQQKYHLYSLSSHVVFNPKSCLKKMQEYQATQFMYLFFANNKDNDYPTYKTLDTEWGSPENFSPLPQYKRQLLFFTKLQHDFSQNQISKTSQNHHHIPYQNIQNLKEEQSKTILKTFLLEINQLLNKKKCRVPFIICLRSLENDYIERVIISLIKAKPVEYLLLVPIIKSGKIQFHIYITHHKIQHQLSMEDNAYLLQILQDFNYHSKQQLLNLLHSIMISSVIQNSLLKTSFKFMSFQRNLVQNQNKSYEFSLCISSLIKMIKQQKEFQIEIKVDPEIPFDIQFNNIIVKDSLEPPTESHIIQYFKVLKENQFETWVLQLIELFLQDTLESIHERTQMMYTDDTQYYRHEIQKLINIDESDLKKIPELDNVVKDKYFPQMQIPLPQHFNLQHQQNQKLSGTVRNFQRAYAQNQIPYARSPNQSNQRNQSGNPYENLTLQQQQSQPRPYLPQQMVNNAGMNPIPQINPSQNRPIQKNQLYQQQQHLQPNHTLNPPVNQQIPRQNSQQPLHPQNQTLVPPVQNHRIRQSSQSGSMNQIPSQQNSNPNLIVPPRSAHQQAPQPGAIVQPHVPQMHQQVPILPPHLQKQDQQIQNHNNNLNLPHQQVQQPSLITQNSNSNHPNIQPHIQNPQYNQYMSGGIQQQQQMPMPPSGGIHTHQIQNIPHQQPPISGGGIQPQINNPQQNIQPSPSFDPNIGPNAYQQHQPSGMIGRSNHPIAPQNY
ncbi:hypothetical protein TTHERM_00052189 (macronuclear) [Tetrahymena thermophila SB210]|uniref:Uncharacterized protein n=1 Tax=Tetrahymena thermophila (strain SB210) TaxID=312017 RepID=A4VE10_TETTS|nr:hypothetical protein TTHERM_00052189 [Tetrahymena thermophila SB210]EDK31775.2 hypothetical protein TTHERM_00052189 [Tetrahymena thermophila SB210]|eukprot:XP_001471329.2 hypothetical protein TTHERM_00052189 [Tetrahymena thermophila SB210]